MDEVEIDGEDFNELEARLYGQIHHEAVDSTMADVNNTERQWVSQAQEKESVERVVTERSIIYRPAKSSQVPDTRYWVNSIKAPKSNSTSFQATTKSANQIAKTVEIEKSSRKTIDSAVLSKKEPDGNILPSSEHQKQTTEKNNEHEVYIKISERNNNTRDKDLRINPAAVVLNSKPNKKKKKQKNIQTGVTRSGPFTQQETKLQKAILIQAKKLKSKNVRNKKQKEQQQVETIVLDSSSEENDPSKSSDDDVVLIPSKPPPLITLSDSDNEGSAIQLEEENAMDASDVVMDSKTKSTDFTKPSVKCSNSTSDIAEKPVEPISSRCTSPCSVLSSDDFIGQTDRCRLLEDNCMADDQDLVLLTADVSNLVPPTLNKSIVEEGTVAAPHDSSSEDVMCTAEFTAPLDSSFTMAQTDTPSSLKKQQNYRVEQTDFRALDVYESESDITDSVYSKGTGRSRTIVNAIDSSSEADDVQKTLVNPKVKRFCKRRTSSSNRGSDAHNNEESTDDELDDGVTKTPVPFILRGSAVERCNKKLRNRSQSLSSRRMSVGTAGKAAGNMSDNEFIATLNSLVQGRENNVDKKIEETTNDGDESSNEAHINNVENKNQIEEDEPTTQPDQTSMQSVQIVDSTPTLQINTEAVPDEAMAGLDNIFASIDNMAAPTKSDDSDSEDSSNNAVEIITPVVPLPVTIEPERIDDQHDLPIRYIVYTECNLQPGGVGWNEEMKKFYNVSWHGERFTLVGVQKGMERDRKLWRIYSEDRFPKTRPYSNLKCFNCCEFGHTRAKCRRPKKPPVCYMCGESGHFEPRCPNTICLRCGNKTQVFTKSCNACTFQNRLICPICKVRGHSINLCPDKWRRYHSTTQPNVHPNSHLEFNKRKMCCICGGMGHFSDTCRSAVRFMEYPIIVSHVKSHQKSYSDMLFKSPNIGLALNLLYRPGDAVVFRMAAKSAPNGFYERFLKAVGLGSMLNRKRPSNCLAVPENSSKRAKELSGHYEPNPYGRVAREGVHSTERIFSRDLATTEAPNQVQEVSGSVTTTELNSSAGREINEPEECVAKTTSEVFVSGNALKIENEFKAPSEIPVTISGLQKSQSKDNLTVDSDSNYSFSDHFEIPPIDISTKNAILEEEEAMDAQPSTSAAARGKLLTKPVREMEPLPDFIPLADITDANMDEVDDNFDTQTGISRRFVAADTDDENDNEKDKEKEKEHNAPCEAKVYLTHFHSNYLLSPAGHDFLVQKSKECNIKARLDWTSVGHVLVIFGLMSDQDTFHKALLEKCHELMDQMNNKQLSGVKVPKRIDALIRFLRENISQLQSDLGDVNDLQKRIKNLEKTHTKANMKLAERFRRLLNMILLGQAGLCDGDKHLDKLLINLKSLINDYQAENMVPQSLREEIDSHSKVIFTSYRHDNYPELIQMYNKMEKGQKLNLNIDPLLLGQKMLDVTLTAEQKLRLEQPQVSAPSAQQSNPTSTAKKYTENNVSNSPHTPKSRLSVKQKELTQSPVAQTKITDESVTAVKGKQRTQNTLPNEAAAEVGNTKTKSNTSTPVKRQIVAPPPFINPQQKSTVVTKVKEVAQNRQSAFNHLERGNTIASAGGYGKTQVHISNLNNDRKAPSQGPSIFWSRESLRYLDECIHMAESNTELLQKLQRIQTKSLEGALSYNDYRAVIKLHGAMVGN
uniref:Zinc finger CCHC domain-containing protein 7 n=1 Tax=Zeugodacus cucurbitae TaxID=28588 RepID=A0A0A1XKI1_ZEUCU